VIRWMARVDDKLLWGDSPQDVQRQAPGRIRGRGEPPRADGDARMEPMSFTFIRGRAQDNRVLMENDPGYLARLALIPGAERKRLLDGDWNAKDSAGDYFSRATFPILEDLPPAANVRRRVRFWDKAATTPSSDNPDPDWTVGVRIAELDDGVFVLEDRIALRRGPAEVMAAMKQAAAMDGRECLVGMWRDPGQAGLVDEEFTRRELFGWPVEAIAARQDKTTYARVWSPLARAGRLRVVRREYLPELFATLEAFPVGNHDDDVDAISGAMQVLSGGGFAIGYDAAPDLRHPLDSADWDEADDDGPLAGSGGYF
jgi:predicted phage terminase large subunit-like protein